MSKVMIGSYQATLEQPKTSGTILGTSKNWTEGSKGAYDFMSLVKKTALACGDTVTAGIVGGYTAGASVPYFFSLVAGFPSMISETFSEKLSFYGTMKFTHNICEITSMGLYSASFFNPMNKVLGSVGTVFDAVSDMTEVPTFAMDAFEAYRVRNLAKELEISEDVQSGLTSRLQHCLNKLVKSVAASVNGFFASYAIIYGAALVTATTALALSMTATICNVVDHYHQNYWSAHVVKDISLVS